MLKLIGMRTLAKYDIPKLATYISQRKAATSTPPAKSEEDFKLIYKLPYIRHASVLNQVKNFQGGLTIFGAPISIGFQQIDLISMDQVYMFCAIGVTGTITLSIFSALFSNLIGLIHLNSDKTIAKIAYLDFWANRKNVEIPASDIIQGSESKSDYLFDYIQRHSTKQSLKIIKKHGIFVNRNDFEEVFGV